MGFHFLKIKNEKINTHYFQKILRSLVIILLYRNYFKYVKMVYIYLKINVNLDLILKYVSQN